MPFSLPSTQAHRGYEVSLIAIATWAAQVIAVHQSHWSLCRGAVEGDNLFERRCREADFRKPDTCQG
jgi:hypothetical protein